MNVPGGPPLCVVWTAHVPELGWVAPPLREENWNIDANIALPRLPELLRRRAVLIHQLRAALASEPSDGWKVGQLVRFALDQRADSIALEAVTTCRAAAWWCGTLKGLVAYHRGSIAEADSLFSEAIEVAPDSVRCVWTDLSVLLQEADRPTYRAAACGADRERLNARLWWLADPLLGDAGNERRAEHFFRHATIALRSAVAEEGERWSWLPSKGGDVVREMLVRYGWPTGSGWNKSLFTPTTEGGLRTMFDAYAAGRVHAFPDVANTLDAVSSDTTWDLYHPRIRGQPAWRILPNVDAALAFAARPRESAIVDCVRETSGISICRLVGPDFRSWPTEHFLRRDGPLENMWHQDGLFRRDSAVLLAIATQRAAEAQWRPRPSLGAALGRVAISRHPDSVVVSPQAIPASQPFVVERLLVPRRRHMVDVEVPGSGPGSVTSRARAWILAPSSLADLPRGAIDVSSPAFVKPREDGSQGGATVALSRMYPSTRTSEERIAVYWETYGISAQDSITFSLQVIPPREAPPGFLSRLFGRDTEADGSARITWSERAGARAVSLGTRTPAFGHELTINIKDLRAGDYTVSISAERGGQTASATRVLTVLPKTTNR